VQGIRKRQGFLTPQDLTAANVILVSGVGFLSRYFEVTVNVTIADTAQSMQSILQRRTGRGGQPEVVTIFRQSPQVAATPPQAAVTP
jgi:hypothetical protein